MLVASPLAECCSPEYQPVAQNIDSSSFDGRDPAAPVKTAVAGAGAGAPGADSGAEDGAVVASAPVGADCGAALPPIGG